MTATPSLPQALRLLEQAGTAQNRKVYARHGVKGPAFGVSFAALGQLRRAIGVDTALAVALWDSGNHDARVLATMIADPAGCDAGLLDRLAGEADNYIVADALAKLAARTPQPRRHAERWTRSKHEFTAQAGWDVVALLAAQDGSADDAWFLKRLDEIESRLRRAPNRVRHAMNMAMIGIGGGLGGRLAERALAAAEAIGVVEVDHGETGCKTPAAAPYIRRMLARASGKARRR